MGAAIIEPKNGMKRVNSSTNIDADVNKPIKHTYSTHLKGDAENTGH